MTNYNSLRPFLKLLLVAALFLFCVHPLNAQNVPTPDCLINFTFTSTGSTVSFNNLTAGCVNWNVSYSSGGFSALSLVVQTAPNTTLGVPGSWSTFAAASGSNPNTVTTSATSTFTGYFPWMRVTLSSITGTGVIKGTLYGWKNAASGGGGGGGSTSVIVTNAPVCTNTSSTLKSAAIAITAASGLQQIVAASGSTTITICSVSILANAITNIGLSSGTGSNCGTGTASVSGLYQNAFGFALDALNLALPASAALCVNSSASITAGGLITFVQQ